MNPRLFKLLAISPTPDEKIRTIPDLVEHVTNLGAKIPNYKIKLYGYEK